MDVLDALTDTLRPKPGIGGQRWAQILDQTADRVLQLSINLDPTLDPHARRRDVSLMIGRSGSNQSQGITPAQRSSPKKNTSSPGHSTNTWPIRSPPPLSTPDGWICCSTTRHALSLGRDRFVIIVGPAGTGKTTMLKAAVNDPRAHGQNVYAVAPTAKAAGTLATETGMTADTVANLVYEWSQPDRPPGPNGGSPPRRP